jgi:hypothetical protein
VLVDLPEIPELDRLSLYAQLGLIQLMEPDTEELMVERAERELVEDEYDSPHGRAWFKSFHGSAFPGDEVDACKRYQLYRMMNIPAPAIMPPFVTSTGNQGKAGELYIADAWYRGGRMLGVPEDAEEHIDWSRLPPRLLDDEGKPLPIRQLGFEVPDVWLSASTDLPILKKGWTKPYIVEVKGKASEIVDEMLTGRRKDGSRADKLRGPDRAHVRQLRATIGAARLFDWGDVAVCAKCWRINGWTHWPWLLNLDPAFLEGRPDVFPSPWSDAFYYCPWCKDYEVEHFKLDLPDCGEIYYWDRSWPRKTKSFFLEHDQAFFDRGLAVLAEAKQDFLDDKLPPRPDHFQWSVGPCGMCTHKPLCRLDFGLENSRSRKPKPELVRDTLSGSNAVEYAQSIRPHYNPVITRATVIQEWSGA